MNITKQELALVNFVKALPFEALLDAGNGIEKAVEEANVMALKLKAQGNPNEAGFRVRAHELKQLAEMLGYVNSDYRAHINPDESCVNGNGTILMIETTAGEVVHLFDVMKKNGVTCSLEFKARNALDPLIGISDAKVGVDYFQGSEEGDSVIIELDEASFSFELRNHSFSKHVSDCQIEVCVISNDSDYSAFFNSGVVPKDGIEEANNYDENAGEQYFAIDTRSDSVAESLEEIIAHLRQGWSIASVGDSIGHDGHLYIDMVRSNDDETYDS